MKKTESIRDYIKNEPVAVQKVLKQMHALARKAAPKASDKLAWGMPTLYQEGNLIHFAAFKNHMSIFPGPDAIVHFKKDLSGLVTSKGTIQIPYGQKLPAGLVTKIVKFCVKRNLVKAKSKAAKKKNKK